MTRHGDRFPNLISLIPMEPMCKRTPIRSVFSTTMIGAEAGDLDHHIFLDSNISFKHSFWTSNFISERV
jgi:hypothetical protein